MSLINKITFKQLGDKRGSLVSVEGKQLIPFNIERVYYLYGMNDIASRGYHAHKTLQQVMICIAGSCKLVIDNGKKRESILLDCPEEGVLIGNNLWREMSSFSDNCILLVLASKQYDEADYIRDYDYFLKMVENVKL